MSASIRLLLLNNFSTYREEIFTRLEEAGLVPEGEQARDKADFLQKLADHKPEVILVRLSAGQDKAARQLDYEQVQNWLAEQSLTIPVWLVVEPQDEVTAVKALYKGVADYFFTDRLDRIAPLAARLVGLEGGGFEPVDLNQIVEAYLADKKGVSEEAEKALTFLPGADLPRVSGETSALRQALFLILGEVYKSSPADAKTDVRTYLDAIKSEVCLEIKLTGLDLPASNEKETAVIIEDSLDLMPAEKTMGTYNGRIDIDQGDEADMRICVSLPAILEKQVKGTPRLLVVENSDLMRSILQEALEHEGFLVKVAENGAAGLDVLAEFQPDLIISDVVMPVMDGFAFFEAVRAQPQWQDIPFVFVTGQSEQKVELNIRALRGATYLIKPIIINELLVAVRSRLPG